MRFPTLPRITGTLVPSLIVVTTLTGCQKVNDLAAPDSVTANGPGNPSDAAFCVTEINRLRATIGIPPLAQSSSIEAFSNQAAHVDGTAHEVHKHFRETNAGGGMVRAENEIPWWDLSDWGSVRDLIQGGLAWQWDEGPGGIHYDNMTGRHTQVACGISIRGGEVTVTQDFR